MKYLEGCSASVPMDDVVTFCRFFGGTHLAEDREQVTSKEDTLDLKVIAEFNIYLYVLLY